jgi:Predicted membrane protein
MKQLRELFRFGCVGVAAMLAHFLAVLLLVPAGLNPLVANAVAFAGAFQISFYGHRNWTFNASPRPRQYSNMLVVSLAAFAMNEGLYALLLWQGGLDYRAALALVLVTVAAMTFIGAKFWAFSTSGKNV